MGASDPVIRRLHPMGLWSLREGDAEPAGARQVRCRLGPRPVKSGVGPTGLGASCYFSHLRRWKCSTSSKVTTRAMPKRIIHM